MDNLFLKAMKPLKTYVYDATKEYVSYIVSCEDNLCTLRDKLNDVCNKKGDVEKNVKLGKDDLRETSREAASWLKDVRILSEDEELRVIMIKDLKVAKMVVRLMEKKVLKSVMREDNGFQVLVVKVMKEFKEEMRLCDDDNEKRFLREDYEKVGGVVVDVMKDTTEEFKTLIKKDRKMAIVVTKMLKDDELQNLMTGDKEMEEIVREVEYLSDDDEKQEESRGLLEVAVDKKSVREAATKLLQPLRNLVSPFRKLIEDEKFKKTVPEVESVKLGFDVIDGLFLNNSGLREEIMEGTKQCRSCYCCCCSVVVINHFHHRYQISKAAKLKADHIQEHIINKCPSDGNLTIPKSVADHKQIPNQFCKAVKSRIELLHLIVDKLKDDNFDVVGVFGMGGTGKTTLAKEVVHIASDKFDKIVMVEVSEIPNIMHIQGEIALSIGLSLLEVDSVAQRAIRLYTQLTSKNEKKTLVILDNIWKKLNLDEVGIPRTCKLLLTTRNREVCRVMGVQACNIHEVGLLNTKEARDLFKTRAGNKASVGEYKNVLDRLMNKCGGLPLAIVATANTLKDKDLPNWRKFADELDRPISSLVKGEHRETYLILETSYMFMESEEKRLFFLLACLSPVGLSVSIEELMRFGIGLDLFQHVNKLSEAMEQANEWANDLVSSSMLLEGDSKGYVKIHDVVRASAILFEAKDEGHKFMVEAIPRWLNKKSFRKYTAISLQSGGDFSRLNGVEADKLQILLLKGNLFQEIPDSFFEGMSNLEVLSLSKMNFRPMLPVSVGKLKKLRTLHLEGCKLGDIKVIGELSSLVVLSLRESVIDQELPNEIGKLSNLGLLDITGSKIPLIPVGVLDSLSQLEGLYMLDSFTDWSFNEINYDEGKVSTNELNRLRYLNALEMVVKKSAQLPIDGQCVKNLDKFRIFVEGRRYTPSKNYLGFHRVLSFGHLELTENGCLKALLKKADWLRLMRTCTEHLVPNLDEDGFRDLISLAVFYVENLKSLCDGDAPSGMFHNLKHLKLIGINELKYMLPLAHVPLNLTEVDVRSCPSLNFFFVENGKETCDARHSVKEVRDVIELPFLKSLKLSYASACQSLLGTKTSYGLQGHHVFFNRKIGFPCLELFSLKQCHQVINLWSKDDGLSGFQNLREMTIESCDALLNLGPTSIFSSLVLLESLTIKNCDKMQEVITEEAEGSEFRDQTIIFPNLKRLTIDTSRNLQCFYSGTYKLEFPALKSLRLAKLGSMNRFSGSESSSAAFFNEKVYFPGLEEVQVTNDLNHVKRLWDWDIPTVEGGRTVIENPVPMLTNLTISGIDALSSLPSITCQDLTCLKIHCLDNEVVFSSSAVSSSLPKLEDLWVGESESLRELFEKENFGSICGQLKSLHLFTLPALNLITLDQFNGLCCLHLEGLNWEYVILADAFVRVMGSLQQLQVLVICDCHKLEVVILDDMIEGECDFDIEFPHLKQMTLSRMNSFNEFSSSKNTILRLPSLESLKIEDCKSFKQFCPGAVVAPNLKIVHLHRCSIAEYFFANGPNQTQLLPSLELVRISRCTRLQSFSSGLVEASKLREVSVNNCPQMQWFLPGSPNQDEAVTLPCLEILDISYCWKLKSFSSGLVLATNLTYVTSEGDKYSLLPFDSLNQFLQSVHMAKSQHMFV